MAQSPDNIQGLKVTLPQEMDPLWEILNSLTDGVIFADQDGRFLFFNTAAQRILGIGCENGIPGNWIVRHNCYRADKVTAYSPEQLPLARAIRGEEVIDEPILIKNPEQPEEIWVSVSATPLNGTGSFITGGVVVLRDITERL